MIVEIVSDIEADVKTRNKRIYSSQVVQKMYEQYKELVENNNLFVREELDKEQRHVVDSGIGKVKEVSYKNNRIIFSCEMYEDKTPTKFCFTPLIGRIKNERLKDNTVLVDTDELEVDNYIAFCNIEEQNNDRN